MKKDGVMETKTIKAWLIVNKKDGRTYCSFGTGKIAVYDTKREVIDGVKMENRLQKIYNNNTDCTFAPCTITYTIPKKGK